MASVRDQRPDPYKPPPAVLQEPGDAAKAADADPAQAGPSRRDHHRVLRAHCPVIQYPYIGRSAAMASRPSGEQF
jgi:hypothetical protein